MPEPEWRPLVAKMEILPTVHGEMSDEGVTRRESEPLPVFRKN